ncbi:MAG: hypothetical protein AAGA58_16190 [Verrucomicrobiota bacterium]
MALIFVSALTASEEPRQWTAKGGQTVTAALIGFELDKLKLKQADGRVLSPPLTSLSDFDQRLAVRELERNALRFLQDSATETQGPSGWPHQIEAADDAVQITREGRNFRSRSILFKPDVELTPLTQTRIVEFFEGCLAALGLVYPKLNEFPESEEPPVTVELFSDDGGYRSAVADSRFDLENGILRCRLKDIGVEFADGQQLINLHEQATNLRREFIFVSHGRHQGNYLLPWATSGISELVSSIPRAGGRFFPDRHLETMRSLSFESFQLTMTCQAIFPAQKQAWANEVSPLKQVAATALVRYFLFGDDAVRDAFHQMIDRAMREGGAWDKYFAAAKVYQQEIEKFKEHPDVKTFPDGSFNYPRTLTPPERPEPPNQEGPDRLHQSLLGILTSTRSSESIGKAAAEAFVEFHRQLSATPAGRIHELRKWRYNEGREIEATLRGFEEDKIILTVNKKPARIEASKLSADDLQFVALNLPEMLKFAGTDVGDFEVAATRKWPRQLSAPDGLTFADLDDRRSEPGNYIYHTRNFEYVVRSRTPLGNHAMKDIARVFEGTYELMGKSPWGIQAKPEGDVFKAEFFSSMEAYHKAGGPTGSGGVYKLDKKIFLVPVDSLGLKRMGSTYGMADDYDTSTLVHELVHMMMHDIINMLPMFLVEGTAEYTAAIPYSRGVFECAQIVEGVKEANEEYFAKKHKVPGFAGIYDFEKLLTMDIGTWNRLVNTPADYEWRDASRQLIVLDWDPMVQSSLYHSSLLLTYFFMHLDGEKDGRRILRTLDAARRDAPLWIGFLEQHEAYRLKMEEFFMKPGVKRFPDGRFTYPPELTPPAAPEPPFDLGAANSPGLHRLPLLFDGRSPKQVASEARSALLGVGFTLE